MKEKFAKLIDVKSIMTLSMTLVFCILTLAKVVSGEQFLTIFVTIVGFYFGTQHQKSASGTGDAVQAPTEPTGTVAEQPEAVPETVNAAMANEIHPPDTESDVVVTGFVG